MADGYEFPVDRTQVMLFARSVRDINPVFSDPDDPATKAAGGIIVPPTFVQSSAHWEPNYGLDITRPRPANAPQRPAGGGGGGLGRGLHAEQHYEYHHPIHVGDTLTVTSKPGERWEKEGRRGGHDRRRRHGGTDRALPPTGCRILSSRQCRRRSHERPY